MKVKPDVYQLRSLLKTEGWVKSLFETLSDSILILDQQTGYIIDVNPAACQLYGYSYEEMIGMDMAYFSSEPDIKWKELQNLSLQIPVRYHHKKDGTIFPAEISSGYFTHAQHSFETAFVRDMTKHFEVENALHISETQLSNAMKMARLGHWVYDIAEDVFTFNDNFYAIYGTTAAEVGGYIMKSTEYARRFVHPEDMMLVAIEIQNAIEASDPFSSRYIEHRYISSNGTEGYLAVRCFIVKDENSKTIRTYGINQDISERKRAEKAIKDSEERYHMLFDNSREAILLTDMAGLINDANPAACEMFGFTSEEICTKNINDLTDKHDTTFEQAFRNRDLAGAFTGELIFLKKDRQLFTGDVFSATFKNRDGKQLASWFIHNITQRKCAEEALLAERTLLRNIVDNLPIALYLKDKQARKVISNPMDLQNIGKSSDDVIGKTDLELLPLDIAEKTLADDFNVLKTGIPIINREEQIVNFEGKSKWLNTSKIPHRNQFGEVIGIIGMGLEITDRKKAEADLLKAKEKAEESDKLKTAFLCNMSHEIRTPMNAILGFSEFLVRPGLSESKKVSYSKLIKERAYDLLTIIEDILDISKIEIGQMNLILSPTNIGALLKGLYEYYAIRKDVINPASRISLKLNLDQQLEGLIIETDEFRLKQVITNLLENAFKFTTEGVIELSCSKLEDNKLLFVVTDTGIGISPEKQGIIFERFRQVDDFPETRRFGGTGLGLAIAKGIVELMCGQIWMESKENAGSKFYFSIPYTLSKLMGNESLPAETDEGPNWKGKTFLIIEDDKANAELLKEIIWSSNATLINAYSGKEAILEFKKNPNIDLVLLDIRLPDEHGLNLVPIMKALRPHVPIIAQTAFASTLDRKKCIDGGCDGYISKPIIYEDFIDIVSSFFR